MSGSIMYSFTVGAARASLSSLDSLPGGSNARLHSPLSICRENKGHQWLQAPGGGKSSRGVPEATSTTSLGEIEVTSRIGLLWSLVGGLMRPGMRERRDRVTNPRLGGSTRPFPPPKFPLLLSLHSRPDTRVLRPGRLCKKLLEWGGD